MSFNIDVDSLLSGAASMFNALWPAMALVVGLGIGIKIISYIRGEVQKAF